MICNTCSVAADLIAEVRKHDVGTTVMNLVEAFEIAQYVRIDTATRSLASFLHGKCRGSTHCDCQHILDMTGRKTVNAEA